MNDRLATLNKLSVLHLLGRQRLTRQQRKRLNRAGAHAYRHQLRRHYAGGDGTPYFSARRVLRRMLEKRWRADGTVTETLVDGFGLPVHPPEEENTDFVVGHRGLRPGIKTE